MKKLTLFWYLAVAILTLGGCSAQQRAHRQNDLKLFGLAYHNYFDTYRKGPSNADDLGPFIENDQRLLDLVRSGEIVLVWDVNIADLSRNPATSSGLILGFEKETPDSGGWVIFGDGSVKSMSADEFRKTPKAEPKRP